MRIATALVLTFLATGSLLAQSDFGYHLPDGWIDVSKPNTDVSKLPQNVVMEGRSGKYVLYAVDPAGLTPQGAQVSVNAIEQTQTGAVTDEALRDTAEGMKKGVAASGLKLDVLDTHLAKLGDVNVGVMESVMQTPKLTLRLLQYVIPGKNKLVVLTYGCPKDDFDRYKPIFEASANATTGAYEHAGNAKKIIFLALLLTAIVVGVIVLVAKRS